LVNENQFILKAVDLDEIFFSLLYLKKERLYFQYEIFLYLMVVMHQSIE